MDTDQSENHPTLPNEESIIENYKYSGFWRRVAAYSIDAILLGVVGIILGSNFYDYFLSIGQTGRVYGLVIYLIYFATLNSKFGNGQTLGKRLLKISVVNQDGNTISLSRSVVRQSIVAAPIFLNGLTLPANESLLIATVLLGTIVFGIGGAISYFLVFNTKTRRTLHDFICGSHVIRVEKEKAGVEYIPLWKGHFATLAIITAGVITAGTLLSGWLQTNFDLSQITALYNKLSSQNDIRQAGVSITTRHSFGNDDQERITTLSIVASPPHRLSSNSEYAMQVVGVALDDKTILPHSDIITFGIQTGFDLGIAKKHTTYSISDYAANWNAAIDRYKTEGVFPEIQFASHTGYNF